MFGVHIGATLSKQVRNLMVGSLLFYFAAWAIYSGYPPMTVFGYQ